jgi:hypothetical protein
MRRCAVWGILVAGFLVCGSDRTRGEPALPAGWRLPEPQELLAPHDQYPMRSDSTQYAAVHADFDGDGRIDEAKFLVSTDGKTYGLFVFLASGFSARLDALPIGDLPGMGVSLVEPGNHRTACGKGYWACRHDEPEVLRLRCAAIDYFKDGSASSVFYWSPKRKSFHRVWTSD